MQRPPDPRFDPADAAGRDLATCRALLAQGSKSFSLAAHLLPRRLRDAATGLYAFCRVADDLIDMTGRADAGVELVRLRVDQIYQGRPFPHPADRAFAGVVRQFQVPRVAVDGLVEGFAWDAHERHYETLPEVLDYAARVAGTVGVMMSAMMGRPDDRALARAADLGMAMQLTNIARDIGEDARNGRLYLPRAWLRDGGLDPETWLANPVDHPVIREATKRLLVEAERLYRRSEAGVALLPPDCRPAIRAARLIYAEIGAAIRALPEAGLHRRAFVPKLRKWRLMLAAFRPLPGEGDAARRPFQPAHAATQFLMAGLPEPAFTRWPMARGWWDLPGRLQDVLPIIERLERAERSLALSSQSFRQSSG